MQFSMKLIVILLVAFSLMETSHARYTQKVQPHSSSSCGKRTVAVPTDGRAGRIVGGNEAVEGEFPWLASIQSSGGQHFCAGFIVSSRYVISAAHCFVKKYNRHLKYNDEDGSVILDSLNVAVSRIKLDLADASNVVGVKAVINHPDFDEEGLENDIAILELQRDIEWTDTLHPICLPKDENEGSGEVSVAGWGFRQCEASIASNELHKITVPLWNAEDCKRAYKDANYDFSRKNFVCAGDSNESKEGKEISKGDSGGPLMKLNEDRWTAIGIVSSGRFMCFDRVPGVYTKISSYLGWIKDKAKLD